ncbi:hypothetical protein EYF80_051286 [Liparis tanakae]|uniref:Uncharacterized protein n=1 Tax=Liparis tanakae TaxID=230148 RepID=A0A4Z2FBH8_9TELE|nr:hypothetical protein EYF80_051286 [Liparis tanakae]
MTAAANPLGREALIKSVCVDAPYVIPIDPHAACRRCAAQAACGRLFSRSTPAQFDMAVFTKGSLKKKIRISARSESEPWCVQAQGASSVSDDLAVSPPLSSAGMRSVQSQRGTPERFCEVAPGERAREGEGEGGGGGDEGRRRGPSPPVRPPDGEIIARDGSPARRAGPSLLVWSEGNTQRSLASGTPTRLRRRQRRKGRPGTICKAGL